jgi:hypothetical protein
VTKLETLFGAVALCLSLSGFLLLDFGGAVDAATQRGAEVKIAVEPPRPPSLRTAPDVDSTGSLPVAMAVEKNAPLISLSQPTSAAIATLDHSTDRADGADGNVTQVTARPSSVLAGPSSSAPLLYGFPADARFAC